MTGKEKELSDTVANWVSDIYSSKAGESPVQVVGTDGNAPSMGNSFLYDPLLDQFEGKLVLNSGETLGFLVYNDKDGALFKTFQA